MPVESLILRRCYPVPVTFRDLREAHRMRWLPIQRSASAWHAAIKEATGAVDEVYAVIDGREVRVAIVKSSCFVQEGCYDFTGQISWEPVSYGLRWQDIADLLIKADEQGYWERPHEVVHVLEERAISRRTVDLACGVTPDKAGAA